MKKKTIVTLEATFPELRGGSYYQEAMGVGNNFGAAFSRAGKNLKKKLGRKKFSMFTVTVTVATYVEVDPSC